MCKELDVYVTKEFYNNLIEPIGKTYRILDQWTNTDKNPSVLVVVQLWKRTQWES